MKLFSVRENFSKSFDFEGDRFNEIITEYEMKAREGQVVTQLVAALRLSKIRMKDNLGIVKVEHDKNFITSDNPITLSKIGGGNVMPFVSVRSTPYFRYGPCSLILWHENNYRTRDARSVPVLEGQR